jgi:hypothetical protein
VSLSPPRGSIRRQPQDDGGIILARTPQRLELCQHVGRKPDQALARSLACESKATLPRGKVEAMASNAAWLAKRLVEVQFYTLPELAMKARALAA